MTNSIRLSFAGLAAALALWPASAEAQAVQPFEEVMGTVKVKDALSLAMDDQPATAARSADGVGDGALIGAGVGLGVAIGVLVIISSGDGYVLPSAKLGAPLLLSGIGAVIGALIDRAYKNGAAPSLSPRQTSRFAVSPFVGKDRQGLLVAVRF